MKKMTASKPRSLSAWRGLLFFFLAFVGLELHANQKVTCLLPLASDQQGQAVPSSLFPDASFGGGNAGWEAYMKLWVAHHQDPGNLDVRRFLGLPIAEPFVFQARRGRTSPRWLGWQAGTFAQVETSHFSIYSTADENITRRVAEDLERCFWIWTQMFFPLWEGSVQVSSVLAEYQPSESIIDFLSAKRPRLSIRRRFQVVLLKDAEQYRQTLQSEDAGIEVSTGFYSDSLKTIFLYDNKQDASETRRHELTHQLFREATRSSLGQASPGEAEGFWLVEGIAGYMESLSIGTRSATVGGWDAPRLQYARYRVLAGGDLIAAEELMRDGQREAQQRSDLSRWYSHSIAHVHALMDGGDVDSRRWVYHRLGALYRTRSPMESLENEKAIDAEIIQSWGRGLQQYLQVNDAVLESAPPEKPLRVLCLTGCEVTETGLQKIPVSQRLTWLDLARLPIGNQAVERLIPDPSGLQQLTLEVTRVDNELSDWIREAKSLRELDMSWTQVGDVFLQSATEARSLSVLWMTGTRITDTSVDALLRLPNLESLDVQRTQISEAGLERIRSARPDLQLNPLELRSP